jgi:flagellin-specific chaperone FliS
MNKLTENNTNILDQIASYNSNNINQYIQTLKQELKEQKQLTKVLQENNSEDNIEQIESFIKRNDGEITDQVDKLENIINELKDVVNENEILKNQDDAYEQILNSENCNKLAEKLRTIKTLKHTISAFLLERGIIIPNY